ncbi:MAG: cytochrome c [Rhizobiaceae bacterium]|nr:cytochrome c [Rhizobiaceae bacterium]
MKKLLLTACFVAVAGLAHADPVADREALMKSFGRSMGELGPIAKGEKAFDAAAVQTALATLNENAQKFDPAVLFPESAGPGESGSPNIWTNWADFEARATKFKTDVAAAAAAPPADVAALQATMGMIGGNCGGCHENFRVKK